MVFLDGVIGVTEVEEKNLERFRIGLWTWD
jgi:hypothetical protein